MKRFLTVLAGLLVLAATSHTPGIAAEPAPLKIQAERLLADLHSGRLGVLYPHEWTVDERRQAITEFRSAASFWEESVGEPLSEHAWHRERAAAPPWADGGQWATETLTGWEGHLDEHPQLQHWIEFTRERRGVAPGGGSFGMLINVAWAAAGADDLATLCHAGEATLRLFPARIPFNLNARGLAAERLLRAIAEIPMPQKPLPEATRQRVEALRDALLDPAATARATAWSASAERLGGMIHDVAEPIGPIHRGMNPAEVLVKKAEGQARRLNAMHRAIALAGVLRELAAIEAEHPWDQLREQLPTLREANPGALGAPMSERVWLEALEEPHYWWTSGNENLLWCRLAAVALSVRLYAAEHDGRLPDRLQDLVPRFLASVPDDPTVRGTQPVLYASAPGTPRLWGRRGPADAEGRDDGGDFDPARLDPSRVGRFGSPWNGRFLFQEHAWLQNQPPFPSLADEPPLHGEPGFGVAATPFGPCHLTSRVTRSGVVLSRKISPIDLKHLARLDLVAFLAPPVHRPDASDTP